MSETASFVDPVFLARFGLSRINVIDYFLHPLNPFRSTAHTSNDVLAMQGMSIGILMQHGSSTSAASMQGGGGGMPDPLSPQAAEEEYHKNLARLTGEQYELVPPQDPALYAQMISSPLYTIRHVLRTNPRSVKVLGVYYVVEGVIYKSPSVRSLMKSNVAKTVGCLSSAIDSLSACARYQPSVGYLWVFEEDDDQDEKKNGPVELLALAKRRKRRKILDHRRPGERTAAEEEGIRASEAIDQILVRLSKSKWVTSTKSPPASGASTAAATIAAGTKSNIASMKAAKTEGTATPAGRKKAP
jgi:hypothetical protein